MLKLIALNYTVMLNGYGQWLNMGRGGQFYREISSIGIILVSRSQTFRLTAEGLE